MNALAQLRQDRRCLELPPRFTAYKSARPACDYKSQSITISIYICVLCAAIMQSTLIACVIHPEWINGLATISLTFGAIAYCFAVSLWLTRSRDNNATWRHVLDWCAAACGAAMIVIVITETCH